MLLQRPALQSDAIFARGAYIGLLVLLVSLIDISTVHSFEKITIGWLENAKLNKVDFQLKAKIDTGATTSSINAKIIKKFNKNKQKWVRFRIENNMGQNIELEKKVLRTVKIKRKLAFSIERPVIALGICLGSVYRELEVNLANRENFDYQMLIGRNFLTGYFLVDSSLVYTAKASCN